MTGLLHVLWDYTGLVGSVLLIALVFRALEMLAPAERGQPLSAWLFNVTYAPFMLALVILINVLLFRAVYSRALDFTGGPLLPSLADEAGGAARQVLFAAAYFVVYDLCQYALHRLQHSVPFLWETHKFHHSETAFNSSTQGKTHALSHVLGHAFHLPVILLFGPRAPHFVAVFLAFRLWGFVNHANLPVSFGPLTPVISGPQWHRIHHSIRPEYHDKNFATFFPFIDIIFGTYCRPRRGEYPASGLTGRPVPALRGATVEPLLGWRRILLRRLGRLRGRESPAA